MPASSKTNKALYSSRGRPVPLGSRLGRGGEGDVYAVAKGEAYVAKLYKHRVDPEKAAKLQAMAACKTDRLLRLTAWPVDTLYNSPGGDLVGFVMPRANQLKEIHILYGPGSRVSEFPEATWSFLVRAASNLARAMAVVHEHGHVVGDVNPGNFLVSSQATVTIIDCDSFQINAGGNKFLCEVGVGTHTPPEIQGRPFKGLVRTTNHDTFGLAVLIFQLLFLGRHPFSGKFLGRGDMPIEKAIADFRFAYGKRAASVQMQPPPHSLPLVAASPQVVSLFERAFAPEAASKKQRPMPSEWVIALDNLYKSLVQCPRNPAHTYLTGLQCCPLCEVEMTSGAIFFALIGSPSRLRATTFDIDAIWRQIDKVVPPGPLPTLPNTAHPAVQASASTRRFASRLLTKRLLTVGLGGIVIIMLIGLMGFSISLIPDLIVAAVMAYLWQPNRNDPEYVRILSRYETAKKLMADLDKQWATEASDTTFYARYSQLQEASKEYRQLPELRKRKLGELEANLRVNKLNKHMRSYRISDAGISGIGSGLTATLQSYGIWTAADLEWSRIRSVPGFGEARTNDLMRWKASVERRFTFNPASGIDKADLAALDKEIANRQQALEKDLLNGPSDLNSLRQMVILRRDALRPKLVAAASSFAEAEAEYRIVK